MRGIRAGAALGLLVTGAAALPRGVISRNYVATISNPTMIAGQRARALDAGHPEVAKLVRGATFMTWMRVDGYESASGGPRMHFQLVRSSTCCSFVPFQSNSGHMLFSTDLPIRWDALTELTIEYAEQWHHYALTWNASDGRVRAYFDGVGYDLADDVRGSLIEDRTFATLGAHVYPENSDNPERHQIVNDEFAFRGQMDDVALFGGALSAEQIAERWNASLTARLRAGLEPDLLLLYDFDRPLESPPNATGPSAVVSRVERNLGTIGADGDLMLGQMTHAHPEMRGAVEISRFEGHVLQLHPPERTPPPLSRDPLRKAVAADAPYVAWARAGERLALVLDDGRVVNVSAPEPFDAPLALELDGGATAVHVWPLSPPLPMRADGGAHIFTHFTMEQGGLKLLEVFSGGGAHGQRQHVVVTRLPGRGALFAAEVLSGPPAEGTSAGGSQLPVVRRVGARLGAVGAALPGSAPYVYYQPEPDEFGNAFDSFGLAYALTDAPDLRSATMNFTVDVTPFDTLPVVEPSASAGVDEDAPAGVRVELRAGNREASNPFGLFVTRLPAKGDLFFDDPFADGARVRIEAEHNPYAVGDVLTQYAHEVLAVSSFWGTGSFGDYHPIQLIGPPSCSTYGECAAEFPDGVPRVGELLYHPPYPGGQLARVLDLESAPGPDGDGADGGGAGATRPTHAHIEYLPQWVRDAAGAWVPCVMDPRDEAAAYPRDCAPVRRGQSPTPRARVPLSAVSPSAAAVWCPASKGFIGAETVSNPDSGRWGPQFVFEHSQVPSYPQLGVTEWVELRVQQAVYVVSAEVGSPRGMGAVVGVSVGAPGGGWTRLFRQPAQRAAVELAASTRTYYAWTVPVCRTHFKTDRVRLELDTSAESGIADWNYVDYVALIGSTTLQSAALPVGVREVTYVPRANAHGSDWFAFSATDCPGQPLRSARADGRVDVTIAPRNDAPHAHDVQLSVIVDELVAFELPADDVDDAGEAAGSEDEAGAHSLVLRLEELEPDGAQLELFGSEQQARTAAGALALPAELAKGTATVWARARAAGESKLRFTAKDAEGARSERATATLLAAVSVEQVEFWRTALVFTLVAVLGACVVLVLCVGGFRAYGRVRAALDAQREQDEANVSRVLNALSAVVELKCPVVLLPFAKLRELRRLAPHERVRSDPLLVTLDTYEELTAFCAEHETVFISHQWLGHSEPDPDNVHFEAICGACSELCARTSVPPSALYVWIDYLCIPQKNATSKQRAIDTLAVCAAAMRNFVVVAPRATHADTGAECGVETYNLRGWCRLEQWARLTLGGAVGMHMWEGSDADAVVHTAAHVDDARAAPRNAARETAPSQPSPLQPLHARPGWRDEVALVLHGDFSQEGDKHKLVDAIIGLLVLAKLQHVAERNAGVADATSDAALLDADAATTERFFPREFFGDLLSVARVAVDALGHELVGEAGGTAAGSIRGGLGSREPTDEETGRSRALASTTRERAPHAGTAHSGARAFGRRSRWGRRSLSEEGARRHVGAAEPAARAHSAAQCDEEDPHASAESFCSERAVGAHASLDSPRRTRASADGLVQRLHKASPRRPSASDALKRWSGAATQPWQRTAARGAEGWRLSSALGSAVRPEPRARAPPRVITANHLSESSHEKILAMVRGGARGDHAEGSSHSSRLRNRSGQLRSHVNMVRIAGGGRRCDSAPSKRGTISSMATNSRGSTSSRGHFSIARTASASSLSGVVAPATDDADD